MVRVLPFLLVTLLLGACSTPQPSFYAPLSGSGGYAEEELGKGLYKVTFHGNAVTPRERVEDYALYRAAELTRSLGKDRFALHDRLVERNTEVTRETYDPFPYYGPYWYRRPYYARPVSHTFEYERTTYVAELTVEPFAGAPPEDGAKIYEADEVIDRLAPQIVRPEDKAE